MRGGEGGRMEGWSDGCMWAGGAVAGREGRDARVG